LAATAFVVGFVIEAMSISPKTREIANCQRIPEGTRLPLSRCARH
jgi:hypothetical protein